MWRSGAPESRPSPAHSAVPRPICRPHSIGGSPQLVVRRLWHRSASSFRPAASALPSSTAAESSEACAIHSNTSSTLRRKRKSRRDKRTSSTGSQGCMQRVAAVRLAPLIVPAAVSFSYPASRRVSARSSRSDLPPATNREAEQLSDTNRTVGLPQKASFSPSTQSISTRMHPNKRVQLGIVWLTSPTNEARNEKMLKARALKTSMPRPSPYIPQYILLLASSGWCCKHG